VPVAINSDAHICFQVGDCSEAVQLAVQAGIEEDAVLNSSAVRVRDYLARHGKVI
jgi:putative hydrolase